MSANDNAYTGSQNRFASMSRDELIVQCQKLCSMDELRKEAFRLEPHDQYRLAVFIAANVGYVLTVEPEYPDSPHNRIDWFEVAGQQGARAMAAEEALRAHQEQGNDMRQELHDYRKCAANAEVRDAAIEECIAAMPSTAENPNEDAYQRGRFDGIIEYQRNLRALLKNET